MKTVSKKIATIEAVLRKSHTNATGEHPVKIRVTFNREAKFYPINIDGKPLYLKSADWDDLKDKQVRKAKKRINDEIDKIKAAAISARDVITANRTFTFDRFEKEFLTDQSNVGFLRIFKNHLNEVLKDQRIGTYKSYNNAYQAFNRFRGGTKEKQGRELNPVDITLAMLKDFETFIKDQGAGKNTVAIYMRGLKVIYNVAVGRNPSLAEFYPFATKQNDRGKYKIRTGSGRKGEALSIEELKRFISTETVSKTQEHEAKLLWLFSFHCQGMNFKDIALLKYGNIKGESITYVRNKTRETEREEVQIEIPLTDSIREIIIALGNPDKRGESHVFDIIPKGLSLNYKRRIERVKTSEERIDDIIRQKIKTTNASLKNLCEANDLPVITTYWARHSYANLLKQNGVSVDEIREMLGHSDARTTEAYLKRFDITRKRKVNERLESILKAS
jgi:integrase/recombinase XerD